MKYFFRQIEDITLENSPVNAEIYFRGANATGLIEKQLDGGRVAVLLFISGEPSVAYMLENGQSRSISLAEFLSLIDVTGLTHAIKLPDVDSICPLAMTTHDCDWFASASPAITSDFPSLC